MQDTRFSQGSSCYLLHAAFLIGLFFDPEDGGDMFLLLNIRWISTYHTALYPRRQNSFIIISSSSGHLIFTSWCNESSLFRMHVFISSFPRPVLVSASFHFGLQNLFQHSFFSRDGRSVTASLKNLNTHTVHFTSVWSYRIYVTLKSKGHRIDSYWKFAIGRIGVVGNFQANIVTCRGVRVTKIMGSSSVDWIY
jgi:hypothetical protein